ncbi:RNA-directed DNA polymerase, eukaryota [Tanacetum coccineum]
MPHVGVGSWFSSLEYASNTFLIDERVVWVDIEGVPLKVWTNNTFNKISSKWGEMLFEEDKKNVCLNSKRVCIKTKLENNIFESFKIIVNGKVFWIRAKEVCGWVPDFLEDEEEGDEADEDTFDDEFGKDNSKANMNFNSEGDRRNRDILKMQMIKLRQGISKEEDKESRCSGHFRRVEGPQTGGSILQLLDDVVKVGQTMGYKMDGCLAQKAKKDWVKELCIKNKVNFLALQETKMENVDNFCIKNCWGNLFFEFVCSPSVGNSGGILCVWDPRMFRKQNSTVSDYFVAIQGVWIPNAKKCLIISVYAPQEVSEKRMLWSYLNHVIDNWSGETIIMGDFNEVWSKEERYGLVRANSPLKYVNEYNYYSSGGLVKFPVRGCAFKCA